MNFSSNFLQFLPTLIITIINVVLILKYSDKPRNYQILTYSFIGLLTVIEIPHIFLSDPTSLIDIFLHIVAGISFFISFSNLRFIEEETRSIRSFVYTILLILTIELLLTIFHNQYFIINPLDLNIVQDVLTTILGGAIGWTIYHFGFKDLPLETPLTPLQ